MVPLTPNFVRQCVLAGKMDRSIHLDPKELQELAEVWLTFQKVMSAIVQPDDMDKSMQELYEELARSLVNKTATGRTPVTPQLESK